MHLYRPDLLSTLKHEIGHVLGFSSIEEPFVLSNIRLFGKDIQVEIPTEMDEAHFLESDTRTNNSLMSPRRPRGERVIQSQLDILAVAQTGGFEKVNLNPDHTKSVPEPTSVFNLLTFAILAVSSTFLRNKKHKSTLDDHL